MAPRKFSSPLKNSQPNAKTKAYNPGLKGDAGKAFKIGKAEQIQGNIGNNPNRQGPFGNRTVVTDPRTGQQTVQDTLSEGNQGVVTGAQGSATGAYGGIQDIINNGGFAGLGAAGGVPSKYEDAVFNRLTANLGAQKSQEQADLEQSLHNRGIPLGSDAYNNQLNNFNQRYDQAYQQARDSAVTQGAQIANQTAGTLNQIGRGGYFDPGYGNPQSQALNVGQVFGAIGNQKLGQQQLALQRQKLAQQNAIDYNPFQQG